MRPEPSVDQIRKAVRYDKRSGKLYWRKRAPNSFDRPRHTNAWNTVYAGKPAFASVSAVGYLVGAYNYRQLKAHRVAWAIIHGYWPSTIDHINGDKTDNRISNLREVTNAENGQNCRRFSNNTTGVAGVSWSAAQHKYRVMIQANGRREYLGAFSSLEDAARVRAKAERRLGFHPNSGRAGDNPLPLSAYCASCDEDMSK